MKQGSGARAWSMRAQTFKPSDTHFHVIQSDGKRASIAISDGRTLEGDLGRRERDLVMGWMLIHREEIWDRWNNAVSGNYVERITPKQI